MLDRIRPRLTYANVMSSIALFAVLGGGAYAASKIGPQDIKKNAVRAKHVKKNQVRAKHIKRNQVRRKHITNGAVTEAKLAEGVIGSGPTGPQGPTGPKGDQGDPGSAVAFVEVRHDGCCNGEIVEERAENITQANVISPEPGITCFRDLGFTPRSVMANARGNASPISFFQGVSFYYIYGVGQDSGCPADTQVTLTHFEMNGATGDWERSGRWISVLFN